MISKGFFRSTLNFLSSFHNSFFRSRTAHYLKRSKNWNSFIELSSLKFVKNNFHFSHSPGKVFRDHAVFEPAGVHHGSRDKACGSKRIFSWFPGENCIGPSHEVFCAHIEFCAPFSKFFTGGFNMYMGVFSFFCSDYFCCMSAYGIEWNFSDHYLSSFIE